MTQYKSLNVNLLNSQLNALRELTFVNFGQFCKNFFREKSKIDQFAKISSLEVSTFPSFAKINSVLKFVRNAIFWLLPYYYYLITTSYKGKILLHKEYNE